MTLNSSAQIVLLGMYLILAILFCHTKQWPVAIYYLGCIVKDAGVFLLAWMTSKQ